MTELMCVYVWVTKMVTIVVSQLSFIHASLGNDDNCKNCTQKKKKKPYLRNTLMPIPTVRQKNDTIVKIYACSFNLGSLILFINDLLIYLFIIFFNFSYL